MQGTQKISIRSLLWEDALENGMTTHSSILTWRIPWTEEPGGLESTGVQSQTWLKWFSTQACSVWFLQWSSNWCSCSKLPNILHMKKAYQISPLLKTIKGFPSHLEWKSNSYSAFRLFGYTMCNLHECDKKYGGNSEGKIQVATMCI